MDKKEIQSIIESLLFVWGEPLDIKDIAGILEISKNEIKKILDEMIDDFNFNRRGLKIICIEDKYQLCTRPEHYQWINKLSQGKVAKGLSIAALETLSIIAYRQPITRNEIESIRGVRCAKSLGTLLDRKLIEERGRLNQAGRPIIYGTTIEFLRYFGLTGLDDLPSLEDFEKGIHNTHKEEE